MGDQLATLREKSKATQKLWLARALRGAQRDELDRLWREYEAARDAYWAERDGGA